jgi:hypothetical protein
MRRNEAAKSSLAALHPEFAWNGGEKWCKSAQNTPGNQPINNSESWLYSEFYFKTPYPPLLGVGTQPNSNFHPTNVSTCPETIVRAITDPAVQ